MKSLLLSLFLLCASSYAAEVPVDLWKKRTAYVCQFIEEGAVGAQIGVKDGCLAYHGLLSKNPKWLYLVDPWQHGLQKDLEGEYSRDKQLEYDWHHKNVRELFEEHINVNVIRLEAKIGIHFFNHNTLDYLYLDGVHSYEDVLRDLTNFWPKLKAGAYIIGNEYNWPGVEPAVKDFLNEHSDCLFVETFINHFVLQKAE